MQFPHWVQGAQWPLRKWLSVQLTRKLASINNRQEWNDFLATYIQQVLAQSSAGFTQSGLDDLPEAEACLFVSNHRDITLDPILVNYALWEKGLPTTQIAIGDNLLGDGFETEFMRINNSFIVDRSARGGRAQFTVMQRTSNYIRQTLESGQSIWIAQREGRAKDGKDRTDPAILKMFAMAYRNESRDASYLVRKVNIVPTSFTYELDPCAPLKAKELAARERDGTYQKQKDEDRKSMALGLTGYKGRIHLNFSQPIQGSFESFESIAAVIDDAIHQTRQPYEIFQYAAELLAQGESNQDVPVKVLENFNRQLDGQGEMERRLLIAQYANQATPQPEITA